MKNIDGQRGAAQTRLMRAATAILFASALATQAAALTAKEATDLGMDAYVYGYPLVTMEFTRRVMTNVAKPEGTHAPMGQFASCATIPTPRSGTSRRPTPTRSTRRLARRHQGAVVLSLPERRRYYLMPMLDGWTDVFQVPGKRTTGTGAQKYAITGPGWKGKLPAGVTEYKSPTDMVWILGRTYCTGTPEDYKAVHALQDRCHPRSAQRLRQAVYAAAGQGRSVDRHEDAGARPGERAGARTLLQAAGAADEGQSAAAADAPMVAKLAKTRHRARPGFRHRQARPRRRRRRLRASRRPASGEDHGVFQEQRRRRELENGWMFTTKTGLYGTDYLQRALDHRDRPRRQPAAGRGLSDLRGGRRRQALQRREQVRHALRQGPDAAGQRLLVADDVRRRLLLRRQPAEPLHGQLRATSSRRTPTARWTCTSRHESPGKDKEANWLPAPTASSS